MARYAELAEWRGPTVNEGDGDGIPGESADHLAEVRGVVLHIAEGTFEGTIAWQKNPSADVSSHFICAKDGRAAQMVDTSDRAWAQIQGNSAWWSIEFEGYHTQALTPQQMQFAARVLAVAHRDHGVPLQVATSPSGRGLGHHSMGAESGVNWGHSDCPGELIKAQKPAIVALANGGIVPVSNPTPPQLAVDGQLGPLTIARWQTIMGTPADGVISRPSALVKAVQRTLNARIGAGLAVDGDGIRQDGKHYKTVAALQRYLGTGVDGFLSVPVSDAVKAVQRRLNGGAF